MQKTSNHRKDPQPLLKAPATSRCRPSKSTISCPEALSSNSGQHRTTSFRFNQMWRRWHGHPETIVMTQCVLFLKAQKPKAFILENVLGISDAPPFEASPLEVISKDLTNAGYNVHAVTLTTDPWINCPRTRPGSFLRGRRVVYIYRGETATKRESESK